MNKIRLKEKNSLKKTKIMNNNIKNNYFRKKDKIYNKNHNKLNKNKGFIKSNKKISKLKNNNIKNK